MTGPLAEYVLLHRHAIAEASLLKRPDIALRLMIAHAMTGSALWDVRAHQMPTKKTGTQESLEASQARAEQCAAGAHVDELFSRKGKDDHARPGSGGVNLVEAFAALLQVSDEDMGDIVAYTMSQTLEAGGSVVEAVLHVCASDPSDNMQPDAAFFDLLRDKRAINAMVEEIGSKELADTCQTETAKAQKQLITSRIEGLECDANSDWRPGWMAVPPQRYVERAPSAPADAWDRVNRFFSAINSD